MPPLTVRWTKASKNQFDALRQRASDTHHLSEFVKAHNEIATIRRDVDLAIEKSAPLYNTKKSGGIVRRLWRDFICVTFYLYPDEQVGFITNYAPIPASWPESDE